MTFTLVDAGSLALAVLSYLPILILPGVLLCAAFDPGTIRGTIGRGVAAVVMGLALLPAIDSVATRVLGLDATLALTLAAALGGAILGAPGRKGAPMPRLDPVACALLLVWLAVVIVEWIDIDAGGRLYQSALVIDMVKHAATTQAIHDSGAPPHDPFFLRPERVSYYYFFYTLSALSERLCGGLIDARAAVGGLVFWVGVGLYGTVRLVLARGGFVVTATPRLRLLILAVLAASGLDVLFVVPRGLLTGTWLADPAWWNEQVTGWFESLLWVPHHLTALIALMIGFVVATDSFGARSSRAAATGAVSAGLAFASAFGASVWVTLAGAVTAFTWTVILVMERRWRPVVLLVLAGLVALLVALPQIHDLEAGRGPGLPIALTIRAFYPLDHMLAPGLGRDLARLLALPFNYFAEFGALFLGTIVYWRSRQTLAGGEDGNELARVLVIGAIVGLGLGTFLRSLLFNNDLGWRVVLLPSFAALIWTVTYLDRRLAALPPANWRQAAPASLAILMAIGYATTLYAGIGLRAYDALDARPDGGRAYDARRATEHAVRVAYDWANHHLPAHFVLQHNPLALSSKRRVVDFGLYSRNPVTVSDAFGSLFGADLDEAAARLETLLPIFTGGLTDRETRARADANHIDALVVTSEDPVWNEPGSFLWTVAPLYASDHLRIVPVAGIARQQIGRLP